MIAAVYVRYRQTIVVFRGCNGAINQKNLYAIWITGHMPAFEE